ncbi:MAG: radical SAM protein [Armatimonadota bacterium]
MNILVLNPPSRQSKNIVRDALWGCWCKGKRIAGTSVPPINQVLTATLLKDEGHNAVFLDALGLKMTLEDVLKDIDKYEAVVLQTSTMTFREDVSVLKGLKAKNNKLITIVYGSHPSFMPEFSLEEGIDFIIRFEHEFALRDLINRLERSGDWENVRGIGYKKDGKIIINPDYPFIEDLDMLPFPDRTLLSKEIEYFNPIVKRLPYTTMFTSRGCPAKCTFCTAPSFMGKKIRFRSAENVVKELEYVASLGYREVFFRDETFTVFKERNLKVCDQIIKRKLDLTWICNARVGTIDKETMLTMKKAGCHMIRFGVESGVQEILDNIKKGIKADKTIETFKIAKEAGMETHAHLMIGLPGDTKDTVNQTINFVKKISPTTATFGICTPYPGTELFEAVKEKYPQIKDGTDADLKKLHTSGFFNQAFCEVSADELEKMVKTAYRRFYLRPKYLIDTLRGIKSFDELKRKLIAGTSVLDFAVRGD